MLKTKFKKDEKQASLFLADCQHVGRWCGSFKIYNIPDAQRQISSMVMKTKKPSNPSGRGPHTSSGHVNIVCNMPTSEARLNIDFGNSPAFSQSSTKGMISSSTNFRLQMVFELNHENLHSHAIKYRQKKTHIVFGRVSVPFVPPFYVMFGVVGSVVSAIVPRRLSKWSLGSKLFESQVEYSIFWTTANSTTLNSNRDVDMVCSHLKFRIGHCKLPTRDLWVTSAGVLELTRILF